MKEDEEKITITLKALIVIILIFIILIITIVVRAFSLTQNKVDTVATANSNTSATNSVVNNVSDNSYYYSEANDYYNYSKVSNTYEGEYDIQYILLDNTEDLSSFKICEYMNYSDYTEYCQKWNLEQKYDYEDYNYIMFSFYYKNEAGFKSGTDNIKAELVGLDYNDNETDLYIWHGNINFTTEQISAAYVITIPTTQKSNRINYFDCLTYSEYVEWSEFSEAGAEKPIIYLYPEEETKVSVNLGYPNKITTSYPDYKTGWNVIAKPNGDLIDLNSGRNLYSLYYESEMIVGFEVEEEGFVVSSEDTVEFLEEKLEVLGLTEREAEEFIIYWLPKLQENEYNYIRFATEEEIEENMPLTITPEPDTVIRVLMTYKGLDEPIEVEEQELETPERTGFVAVEWGGTEIK